MNEIDLDINNYDLNDLLKLFKLKQDFSENELKKAKKIVLATHPDKSNLNSKYFLFFAKAYKLLVKIYNINQKRSESTDYSFNEIDKESKNNKKYFEKVLEDKNFNTIFNKMFEENIKIADQNGYGEWLSSNDDIETRKSKSLDEMKEIINEKKQSIKSLIKHNEINDINYSNTNINNIDQDEIQTYSSDIFSKFQYEDLKKAHTETVVPVTDDDFNNVTQYNNVDDYKNVRTKQNTKPLDLNEINNFIRNKEQYNNEENINRAYKLVKQDQIYKDQKNILLSKLKQITQ